METKTAAEFAEGPGDVIVAANQRAEEASRKRNTTYVMAIFQSICAAVIVALLGWACTYISDIAKEGRERDKAQAVFAAEMKAQFTSAEAARAADKQELLNRFAIVEASQKDAKEHAQKVEDRVAKLESQLEHMSTVLQMSGISADSTLPVARKRP